jgi:hypothetical protein
MSAPALLDTLAARGVALDLDGDRLRIEAPVGELSDDDRKAIRADKSELIALLLIRRALDELADVGGAAPALSRWPDLHLEPPGVWCSGGFIIPTRATMPAIRELHRRQKAAA